MLYLRRIFGNSMLPTLQSDDYILALKNFYSQYKLNDIIIVSHPVYGELIKRIQHIDNDTNYWLSGDGKDTLSSEAMGAIPKDKVLGKMIWHIHP